MSLSCHHPWAFISLFNTKIYLHICKRLSLRCTVVSKLSQRPGSLASHIPRVCGAHRLVVPLRVQVSIQEGFSECGRMLPDVPPWLCSGVPALECNQGGHTLLSLVASRVSLHFMSAGLGTFPPLRSQCYALFFCHRLSGL